MIPRFFRFLLDCFHFTILFSFLCFAITIRAANVTFLVLKAIKQNKRAPKVIIPRSLSHKTKQARSDRNIPRSLSHKTKQARITCIVPRSISHESKKARFRKKSENRTIQLEICHDLCKIGQ